MSELATESPVFAMKGRFTAPEQKYYGIFLLVINQNAGYIDMASIVASIYSEVGQTNLDLPWSELDSRINKLKYEGQYAQSVTFDLQESLKNLAFDADFLNDILKDLRNSRPHEISKLFSGILGRVLRDNSVACEFVIEPVRDEALKSAIASDPEPVKPAEPAQEGVVLPVSLVLAPVGGKIVTQLKAGDVIMVKIDPKGDRANYFIDLYKLRTEKGTKPTAAQVVSITPKDRGVDVLVKLDEGVFGSQYEEEKILVREYDAKYDGERRKSSQKAKPASVIAPGVPTTAEKQGPNFSLMISAGVIILLLLFGLLYLFLAP